MAKPARTPDPRPDPLDPESRRTDPFAPDPRLTPANAQMVNRFKSRTGGTGILIAAVLLVLALIAYFAFATGDDTAVAPGDPAVTEQPADATPAPDATAPADPAPADTARRPTRLRPLRRPNRHRRPHRLSKFPHRDGPLRRAIFCRPEAAGADRHRGKLSFGEYGRSGTAAGAPRPKTLTCGSA